MATKEYDALCQEDVDSTSSFSEGALNTQISCPKCAADLASRARYYEGKRRFLERPTIFQAVISILLLTANLGMLALWWKSKPTLESCIRPLLTMSPAKNDDALLYERRRLVSEIDANVWTGPPRPVHDEAWARIIEPITIKISEEELKELGEDSIALADGSGYLGELSVYHELHCIKRIRRHQYLDYYYPNMTELQLFRENLHYDHCLEYWREAAMCRADTSVATFFWRGDDPVSRVYSERECVNWERLDSWARTRMVNMTDRSILQREGATSVNEDGSLDITSAM